MGETLPHKSQEDPDRGDAHQKGISRREFLKFSGAALLQHWFERSFPDESKNERLVYYNEIVHTLREAVRRDPKERLYMFASLAGSGKGVFLNHGSDRYVAVPAEKVRAALRERPGSVQMIHTHPLNAVRAEIDPAVFEALQKGKGIPPSLPPSFSDIIMVISDQQQLDQQGIRTSGAVFEPGGVWEYRADLSHAYARDVLRLERERDETWDAMHENESFRKFWVKYRNTVEAMPWTHLVDLILRYHQPELDQEALAHVRCLGEIRIQSFPGNYAELTLLADQLMRGRDSARLETDREKFIESWMANGVALRFWTYDRLEREIMPPVWERAGSGE